MAVSRPITVAVSAVGSQVYSPAVVGKPHGVINNPGPGIVYLGQKGVTALTGFPLRPLETIELPVGLDAIYGVAGGLTTGANTTTTAAVTHGASTVVAVTAITGIAGGATVQLGAGTSAEILSIASTSTAPSVTFTSKPVLDHVSGATLSVVTGAVAGTLRVTTGTT